MSHRLLLATILFTSFLLPSWAKADIIGFERIVDTQTRVPNDPYNSYFYRVFNATAIGNDVYFIGQRWSSSNEYYSGLFRSHGGVIEKLVDTNDVIPGSVSGEKFDVFGRVSVNDGRIVFAARTQNSPQSLYELESGNTVIKLEDNGATQYGVFEQPIPLADGSVRFQSPKIGNTVSQPGFYKLANGVRTPLANNTTAIPSGTGNFLDSSFEGTFHSDIDTDGTVVFRGEGSDGQIGLYSDRGGLLDKVFDVNDTMPGTSSNFIEFQGAKINDGIIGVLMVTSHEEFGLFKIDQANQLIRVVDNATVYPETGTKFERFGSFDFDKDIFLFEGLLALGSPSLFYDDGLGIKKFLGVGDQFDGRSIKSVSNPQSIGNGEFLFSARYDDAQDGIFRVKFAPTAVPEPSAVAILFFGTVLCATSRRRSRTSRASTNTFA